jgi:hypothetical protein
MAGIAALLALLTPNPFLTAISILVVPLFVTLLWRQGEAPVLLFIVMFQWLQVTAKIFHANFLGLPVAELALTPGSPVNTAIVLGLSALILLAVGQRIGRSLLPGVQQDAQRLLVESKHLSPKRLFGFYLLLLIGEQIARTAGWSVLSVLQLLLAVGSLKWVPFFALASIAVSYGRGREWMLLALLIEVLLGFGGYFSSFKTVFFILLVASLLTSHRLSRRQGLAALLTIAAIFSLSVVWTGIKVDYRRFLNQGERAQVIRVSWDERTEEFVRLVTALSGGDLSEAVEEGLSRVAYVDYFADSLRFVPTIVPHANGEIWGDAVRNVLMPRFLFPHKPILLSDSELTMRYTGHLLASDAQGTSISLGYVAESYVDFGLRGMWVPIFLMGLLQGSMYAFLVRRSPSLLFGYGLALAALLPGMLFESSAIKYLGGMMINFCVFIFIVHWRWQRLMEWLADSREWQER